VPWDEIPASSKEERSSFLPTNKKSARPLVDERVDPALADMLRQSGWTATHVREVGILGHPDENVLAYAQREDLILLTTIPTSSMIARFLRNGIPASSSFAVPKPSPSRRGLS